MSRNTIPKIDYTAALRKGRALTYTLTLFVLILIGCIGYDLMGLGSATAKAIGAGCFIADIVIGWAAYKVTTKWCR